MKPHKWAKEIKAWADGAEIEMLETDVKNPEWIPFEGIWYDSIHVEYRIKPQQQQSSCCKCQQTCSALKEPQYLYVYVKSNGEIIFAERQVDTVHKMVGKIKLEQDDVDSV